jgi:hypothetical protein
MTMTNSDGAAILNAMRGTGYAAWTPYLVAFTADPTVAGATTNELTGGSYARQAVTFGVPSSKSTNNTAAVTFSATAGTVITHIGLADAVTGGTIRRFVALSPSVTVGSPGTVTVPIGALVDTLT